MYYIVAHSDMVLWPHSQALPTKSLGTRLMTLKKDYNNQQ